MRAGLTVVILVLAASAGVTLGGLGSQRDGIGDDRGGTSEDPQQEYQYQDPTEFPEDDQDPTEKSSQKTTIEMFRLVVEAIGGEYSLEGLVRRIIVADGHTWIGYEGAKPGELVQNSTYARSTVVTSNLTGYVWTLLLAFSFSVTSALAFSGVRPNH